MTYLYSMLMMSNGTVHSEVHVAVTTSAPTYTSRSLLNAASKCFVPNIASLTIPSDPQRVFLKRFCVKSSEEKNPEETVDPKEHRIVLNVGGMRHETCLSTLNKFPGSRLHTLSTFLEERLKLHDSDDVKTLQVSKEYFFDRDPQLFSFILNFYRTGELHTPLGVCGPMFKSELSFWHLDERYMEPCCFVTYVSYEDTNEALSQFEYTVKDRISKTEDYIPRRSDGATFWQRTRPRIWKGLQNPYSSTGATVYAVISMLMVLVSITVFVVETLPYFGHHTIHSRSNGNQTWTSQDLINDFQIFTDIQPYDMLIMVDNCCNMFFFLEYLVKLISAPAKLRYIRSPSSVIELACIIPYYLAMLIVFLHEDPIVLFDFLRVLYATRVLRIVRIFALMNHFMALKILIYTIKASTKELLLLVLIMMIGVIIFACTVYYAELLSETEEAASKLPHIPIAFWWAVVTMTTVGYGDVVPTSALGYIIGACCAVSGVLLVALTVPIIVNNFSVYYTHAQSREKLKLRRKQLEDTQHAVKQWKKITGVAWARSVLKSRSDTTTSRYEGNKGNKIEPDTGNDASGDKIIGNNVTTEQTGASSSELTDNTSSA